MSARRTLVTGGSSGIGLALARDLSARGDRVAILARGETALEEAAEKIDPRPVTIAADVADAGAMREAMQRFVALTGGLDAVVANAAAAAYGPFAELGIDDHRATVETSLVGTLNTVHAALPHLERTGGAAVIVGSVAGRVPVPWLASYTAAKHGVRGFARTLEAELRATGSRARVALVAPGPVDTPFWRHARTADGRLPPELPGVYRPEDVVKEIVRALDDPRPERFVGGLTAVWAIVDAVAPNAMLRLVGRIAGFGWRKREERPTSPDDRLHHPGDDSDVHGGLASRPSVTGAAKSRP